MLGLTNSPRAASVVPITLPAIAEKDAGADVVGPAERGNVAAPAAAESKVVAPRIATRATADRNEENVIAPDPFRKGAVLVIFNDSPYCASPKKRIATTARR